MEATRAALDEALVTLATDEREEKDRLVLKATGMRDELETVSALIRSKGILTQAEKEVEYNRAMNKDIEAAISYAPEIEDV